MRKLRQFFLTTSVLLCSALTSWADPYGGTPQTPDTISATNYTYYGFTADDWQVFSGYYGIRNAAELYGFAALVNNGEPAANAVLTDDIVVNLNVPADGILNGATMYSWTPIGTSYKKYAGTFDGNGHTISGLFNNSNTNYVGLIGYTNGATIKNIGVVDSYIKGNYYVGGICGYGSNTTITNCYNTGTVSGTYSFVGGICGYGSNITITNCYNTGTVSGSQYVGGICGHTENYTNITITNCHNTGTVTGSGKYVGGICGNGSTSTTITNCHNIGTVTGSDKYVGGICGYGGYQTNCYNTGTVTGSDQYVGGICGFGNGSTKTNCYNTGTVSGSSNVGGICGYNATVINCYYLEDCGSQNTLGVSVTATELKSGKITFLLNEQRCHDPIVWYQTLDDDASPTLNSNHLRVYAPYPCFRRYEFSNTPIDQEHGDCDALGVCSVCGKYGIAATLIESEEQALNDFSLTAEYVGYYAIENAAQLYWFAQLVNEGKTDANALLTDDIVVNLNVPADGNLNGATMYSWTPIGTSSKNFKGTFDGNGHTISGLYFSNTTNKNYPNGGIYVGLIGYAYGATIKNVGVIDSYIKGANTVGGICGLGHNSTTITNCHNTGTVSGYDCVGGICGYWGIHNNCYNTGTVSGSGRVGGICGDSGYQTNCYNTGTVSGSENVGGICGIGSANYYTQTDCYNIGTVSGSGSNVGGICGKGGIQYNCYYMADCGSKNTLGTPVPAAEFESGKVTYLLNGSTSGNNNAWRQNLDDDDNTDAYPVSDTTHAVVYASQPCATAFSNTEGAVNPHSSVDETTGYCSDCGRYSKAATLTDGVYQIGNAAQLYWFAVLVNNGETTANAMLTDNIVVNLNVPADGNLNGATMHSWTPIGTSVYGYQGTFDGNGHTISGLYFENTTDNNYPDGGNNVGLIGYASGATIKNVGVIDSYIKGYQFVGGICGYNSNTTVTNCYNTGTVSGVREVGGICSAFGTQTNCYNTGTVSGTYSFVGGICGYSGTQTNCYNIGAVSGSGSNVGCICGSDGTQINCYYLVGCGSKNTLGVSTTAAEFESGKITYLLNGSTSGNNNVWRQNLNGEDTDACPVLDTTHAVVYSTQPCATAFCNTQGAVKEHQMNATGHCSACGQLIAQGTLVTESNCDSLNLSADFVGYYAISNSAELYWFANEVNNGNATINAVLTADIVVNLNVPADGNLNGATMYSWTPIGTKDKPFAGTFDGNGHIISGLYFNNTTNSNYPDGGNYVGLIGYAKGSEGNGAIKNVGVIDSYIRGYQYVGGICGYATYEGYSPITITNCYNTGTVSGTWSYVGGICGNCHDTNITITNCYNTGTVKGSSIYVGGICGDIGCKTNCYYLAGCAKDGNDVVQYGVGNATKGYTTADVAGRTTAVAAEDITNGRLTYLLNGSTSEGNLVWYQTIGTDALPVWDSTHGVVYVTQPCTSGFSNTEGVVKAHSSVDEITGYCPVCGQFTVHGILVTESNRDSLNLSADFVGYYAISNTAKLYWFANEVNSGNNTINAVLTADIEVNKNVLNDDGTLNGTPTCSWTPIGTSIPFEGTFDGNGHTISGLYFNNPDEGYVGMIGYAIGAKIKNVGVIDSYLYGCYYVGGICGYGDATITNCYNTGTVSGSSSFVGGICGIYGAQTNCYNTGKVSGTTRVGGICGGGTVTNCYYLEGSATSSGGGVSVTAEEFASGKIGYLLNGKNGTVWHQNLFEDAFPVLDATHNSITGYVVEEGNEITVYGNLLIASNYEIPAGKTLYIPVDATVTTTGEAVITNNETIIANGSIAGNSLAGNGSFVYNVLGNNDVSLAQTSFIYKGAAFTLDNDLEATISTHTLCDKIFTFDNSKTSVSYENNRNVGDNATVTWENTNGSSVSKTFSITRKTLAISNIKAENKVYDGNPTTTVSYSADVFSGDNVTFGTAAAFDNENAGNGKTVTFNYTKSGDQANNYAFEKDRDETTANITPKAIEISNIAASGKTYDGNTTATITYSKAGILEGDVVTVSHTAAFADKNVGEAKPVSFNFTKTGTDEANYEFDVEECAPTADISARELTLSNFTAANKVYDGTKTVGINSFSNDRVEGDKLEFSYNVAFADANAAEAVEVNFSNIAISGGADKDNYDLVTLSGSANADITPVTDEVVVTVTLADKTVTYNGIEQSYSADAARTVFAADNALYNVDENVAESGNAASVSGTNAGNYPFGWTAAMFGNTNTNFSNVTFNVTDGKLIINKIDGVQVKLTGNKSTVKYDGEAHTVEGFAFEASNSLYTVSDIMNSGLPASATQTEAGEKKMGLLAANFSNVNRNFSNVTFEVEDGGIVVEPKNDVVVTITENSGSVEYTGAKQKVEGYTFASNTELYTESDITFGGTATAAGTTIGTYPMELSAADFSNNNPNFTDVTFNIVDGALSIVKSSTTPNLPASAIETYFMKLSLVALPENWAWEDNTMGLVVGNQNEAAAKYVGNDAGNYVTESVGITITRLACDHNAEHTTYGYVAATCTEAGYTGDNSCSRCGMVYQQGTIIPALKHNYEDEAIAATCTEVGYTKHTCKRCNDVIYSDTVPAAGHKDDMAVYENIKAATCTVAGSQDSVVYCSVCNAEISRKTVEIKATGHTAAAAVAENLKAATCTEAGSVDSVVYCSVCNTEISRKTVEIKATGHTAGEAVAENLKAATCTEAGSVDSVVYCSVCKDEISRKTVEIKATGHTAAAAVAENLKAATCTEAGSVDSVVYCSVCNAEISRKTVEIKATGHTAAAAVAENLKPATCTEAGSVDSVVYCSVCNAEISRKTVEIPATGHIAGEAVIENVVAATYTAAGSYDSVVYCTVCKEELSRVTIEVPQLVKPAEAEVVEIVVSQVNYTVGDSLKLDGGKLVVATSDSTTAEVVITPEMVSGFNPDSVGVQTVTVSFEIDGVPYTTTFEVTVKDVAKPIDAEVVISQTNYTVGDSLKLDGGKLVVATSDSTTVEVVITPEMVSGFNPDSVGVQTVTVSFEIDGVPYTTTFEVEVKEPEVIKVVAKSIAVSAKPAKVEYKQGETLDVTGGKLTVTFSDNTTKDVDLKADMVSGFDADKVGEQKLTVIYTVDGVTLTATFNVTVTKEDDNTAISDDEAAAVNIYAYGNTIVVENATDDIFVFDSMGRMIKREAANADRTEIQIDMTGVYIVKTGNTTKRVILN